MQITEPRLFTRETRNVKYNSQHLRGPKNTQTRIRARARALGNITYCIKQQRQTATEIMKRNVQYVPVCVPIHPCMDAKPPFCVSLLRFTKRGRERDIELSTCARESVRESFLFFPTTKLPAYIPYRFLYLWDACKSALSSRATSAKTSNLGV